MSRSESYVFWHTEHILSEYKNTKSYRISVFFHQEVLMTVDAAVVIKIFYGLPGMRSMGLAKQLHRTSSPVLPYRCTCAHTHPFFCISGTAGRIVLKLGVWLS